MGSRSLFQQPARAPETERGASEPARGDNAAPICLRITGVPLLLTFADARARQPPCRGPRGETFEPGENGDWIAGAGDDLGGDDIV